MKNKTIFIFLGLGIAFLMSCQDKIEDTYIVNEPVYLSYNDLRSSFKVTDPGEIIQPGKIYFKDNLIFVNEYQKGIHVIDNSDPQSPQIIKFIEIPGNIDMAIKGNLLYADSYVDLVTINISDLNNIREVDRDTNIFPYILPPIDNGLVEPFDETRGVITGWEKTSVTRKVEDVSLSYRNFPTWEMDMFFAESNSMGVSGSGGSDFGVGGSMARFVLYDDYLYTIDNVELKLFDISTGSNPLLQKEISIGWNIETLFPYNDKLFIGSQTGMYIYDLADPLNPSFISLFVHATACDPVVVENNFAYVTLRSGNLCGALDSQLDVIDISDLSNPKLLEVYPMTDPYGLGIDNNVLFVCDGNDGLKIYDATDKLSVDEHVLATYPGINAFDVIPLGDVLLMIGIDGLYQYDYSDIGSISQLSHIPIYGE